MNLNSVIRNLNAEKKSITQTKDRLDRDLARIEAGLAALQGQAGGGTAGKKRRKMSQAHKDAISRAKRKASRERAAKSKATVKAAAKV